MANQRQLFELFEFISAEDDERFFQRLLEVDDPNDLNIVHQVYTPLCLACNFDRNTYVRALLEKGASVNSQTGTLQQYPVHFAAKGDNKGVKCMKLLLEFGADLSAQDRNKDTPLHHACSMENVLLFDFLMANGANVNVVNADGETPLIRAIVSQNEYFINQLIASGSDVNLPDGDPLDFLIRQYPPMTDSINLFLSRGADILRQRRYLHTAAANNNINILHLLKDAGVNVNTVIGNNNFTALHHACDSNRADPEIVNFLLQWGSDVHARSATLNTPLHLACLQCNLRKIILLLNFGANVMARNAYNYTALTALLMSKFPNANNSLHDFYQIFKILVASGTPVTNCDLEIFKKIAPVNLRRIQTKEEIIHFLKAVQDYACKPRRLLHLCRSKIRYRLPAKVNENVAVLPLPLYLKEFMLFKDILGFV